MTTITTRKAGGTWVVRTGSSVIAESTDAVELTEGALPPVIYFPRADVAMAFLDRTEKTTHCPHKGDAAHFTISSQEGPVPNAAWSYEAPLDQVARIAGHLAFYTDKVTVEQL